MHGGSCAHDVCMVDAMSTSQVLWSQRDSGRRNADGFPATKLTRESKPAHRSYIRGSCRRSGLLSDQCRPPYLFEEAEHLVVGAAASEIALYSGTLQLVLCR